MPPLPQIPLFSSPLRVQKASVFLETFLSNPDAVLAACYLLEFNFIWTNPLSYLLHSCLYLPISPKLNVQPLLGALSLSELSSNLIFLIDSSLSIHPSQHSKPFICHCIELQIILFSQLIEKGFEGSHFILILVETSSFT